MHIRKILTIRRLGLSLALLAPLSIPAAAQAQLYTGTQVPAVEILDPGGDVLGVQAIRGQVAPTGDVRGAQGLRSGQAGAVGAQTGVRSAQTGILGAQGTRSGSLALTGGDIGGLVTIGLGALAAGLVLARRGRRSTSA